MAIPRTPLDCAREH